MRPASASSYVIVVGLACGLGCGAGSAAKTGPSDADTTPTAPTSTTSTTDDGGSTDAGGNADAGATTSESGTSRDAPRETPTTTPGSVCFFADENYLGKSFCVGVGTADTTPDWNDTVSSVKVTAGFKAELFVDAGESGRVLTLIADEPHLTGCYFNDVMSSYRVSVDVPSKLQTVNFLRKISGCKIVAGQHNDEKGSSPHYYNDIVHSITGQEPALWSGDFGFSGDSALRWNVTHEAEAQWKKGAVINMMFHACPPTQGSSCGWDGGVKSYLDDGQWSDLITDGGTLNKAWKARLDELVPYFQELADNHVEVMFRPHHEMNQSVFWWGGRTGPNGTARLFQITHDYLVVTKGFSNLGFVWDVQNLSTNFADYDPGDAYWDISAVDYYGGGSADSVYGDNRYYDAMLPLTHSKPMAIGESFFLPTPAVQQNVPQMSFFMIWAYGIQNDESGNSTNSNAQIIAAYSAPRVLKLADMPGWK